ncbi:hypothetical protein AGABI1DRAFT_95531 [Agaricus bisporus var. burnettii JB137-S8]|uniref:Uncharacterized protein n=1 Tax=Agaricus bisporus var. burnettii (strain JB137-S8 / ATCC MYA-4627 / FGSC 10392) TaxID=597362 RepID=K5WVM5_AGABU|nr:uncharacterized protein AGABI1DRAFT_95531 [Agaricus bisporus var. burnettii JB137-S8]EKM74582.1 hypothetical protein AGABI1DRAFT_95531 [Agaricus bisporus var. burnettii JB137-S8]
MSTVQQMKKQFWENKTAEVRCQVKEHRAALAMAAQNEDDHEETEDEEGEKNLKSKLAEMKQRGKEIKSLVAILDVVAKELNARTGFIMTFLIGGLEINGALKYSGQAWLSILWPLTHQLTSLHYSKTPEGKYNFKESMVDFEEWIMPKSKQNDQGELYKKPFGVKGSTHQPVPGPMNTDAWSREREDRGSEGGENEGEEEDANQDDEVLMASTLPPNMEESSRSSSLSTVISAPSPSASASQGPSSPTATAAGPISATSASVNEAPSPSTATLPLLPQASASQATAVSLPAPLPQAPASSSPPVSPPTFSPQASNNVASTQVLLDVTGLTPAGTSTMIQPITWNPQSSSTDCAPSFQSTNIPGSFGSMSQELNWALQDAQSHMNFNPMANRTEFLGQNYMPHGGYEFSNDAGMFFNWLGDGSWLGTSNSITPTPINFSDSQVAGPLNESILPTPTTTAGSEGQDKAVESSISSVPASSDTGILPARTTATEENAPPPASVASTTNSAATTDPPIKAKNGKGRKGRKAALLPTTPLQGLDSNLGRSTRKRKRRGHPDEAFQEQQEAREYEQKQRKVEVNKATKRKKTGTK